MKQTAKYTVYKTFYFYKVHRKETWHCIYEIIVNHAWTEADNPADSLIIYSALKVLMCILI